MGKMSKPQRSSKHKKMKAIDPFYVGDRPVDRHADKFNLAPRREEGQEYSRSVQELLKLKQSAKTKAPRKKKRSRAIDNAEGINDNLSAMERGCTRPFKQAPNFKQRKGENEASFFNRVDRETMAVVNKAQFEDKFDIGDNGPVLDIDKKTSDVAPSTKSKTRLIEKKRKLKESKNNKIEDRIGGFGKIKDVVQFGDVVQAPPTLTVRPRKATEIDNTKIGTKKLLLSAMFAGDASKKESKSVEREIGKTIKSKKMTPAARYSMDLERERTIRMYREMKELKQRPLDDD